MVELANERSRPGERAIRLSLGEVRSGQVEARSAQKQKLAQLVAAVLGLGQL